MSEENFQFAYINEFHGIANDLSKKDDIELKELLDRQTQILKNKTLVSKLKDKGEKVRKLKDEITKELKLRSDRSNTVLRQINKLDLHTYEWKSSGSKNELSKTGEDDKDIIKILSDNASVPKNPDKKVLHVKHIIEKEKSQNLIYKPHRLLVAKKIKNIVPGAPTANIEYSTKSITLDKSLDLLTQQISSLKINNSTFNKKDMKEFIDDRTNEITIENEEAFEDNCDT